MPAGALTLTSIFMAEITNSCTAGPQPRAAPRRSPQTPASAGSRRCATRPAVASPPCPRTVCPCPSCTRAGAHTTRGARAHPNRHSMRSITISGSQWRPSLHPPRPPRLCPCLAGTARGRPRTWSSGDLDDPAEEGVHVAVQVRHLRPPIPNPHTPAEHVQVRVLKCVAHEA
jgi:hypothetical protein